MTRGKDHVLYTFGFDVSIKSRGARFGNTAIYYAGELIDYRAVF
jgi:hypothetical protein